MFYLFIFKNKKSENCFTAAKKVYRVVSSNSSNSKYIYTNDSFFVLLVEIRCSVQVSVRAIESVRFYLASWIDNCAAIDTIYKSPPTDKNSRHLFSIKQLSKSSSNCFFFNRYTLLASSTQPGSGYVVSMLHNALSLPPRTSSCVRLVLWRPPRAQLINGDGDADYI